MQLLKRINYCTRLFFDLMHVVITLIGGLWRLSKIDNPVVTIFGGSKVDQSSIYAQQAKQLAQLLVNHDISILTGGGPGIMQSANCGAVAGHPTQVRSIGVGVRGLDDELINVCAQEYIVMDYFFARKWLLTQYSIGFAVFPGGFGTLDELAEVLTLMQTHKLPPVPIVLIGVAYWKPLMDWIYNSALKHQMLKEIDINLINITDDIHQAFTILHMHCTGHKQAALEQLRT